MARGTVKWFSDSKGYGFITTEDTQDSEVYVHHSAIVAPGFRTLHPGEVVEFEVKSSAMGAEATQVSKI
jgi:cold shock protein